MLQERWQGTDVIRLPHHHPGARGSFWERNEQPLPAPRLSAPLQPPPHLPRPGQPPRCSPSAGVQRGPGGFGGGAAGSLQFPSTPTRLRVQQLGGSRGRPQGFQRSPRGEQAAGLAAGLGSPGSGMGPRWATPPRGWRGWGRPAPLWWSPPTRAQPQCPWLGGDTQGQWGGSAHTLTGLYPGCPSAPGTPWHPLAPPGSAAARRKHGTPVPSPPARGDSRSRGAEDRGGGVPLPLPGPLWARGWGRAGELCAPTGTGGSTGSPQGGQGTGTGTDRARRAL